MQSTSELGELLNEPRQREQPPRSSSARRPSEKPTAADAPGSTPH